MRLLGRGLGALCLVFGLGVGCADDGAPPLRESASQSAGGTETATTGSTTELSTSSTSTTTDETGGSTGGGGPSTVSECFENAFEGQVLLPNYDQFDVVPGSHCQGTNHQDIMEVDRVVFLGDSVTVGTPPTASRNYYRSQLADALVDRFALDPGSDFDTWKSSSVGMGTSQILSSGDFWSCSEWGARNDDFLTGGMQIEQCFPEDTWDQKTLVVMTMGGNDLLRFAQDLAEGAVAADVQTDVNRMLADKRAALEWMTDSTRFPNGNSVVFANVFEFTDGTADFLSCPLAVTVGFTTPLEDTAEILLIVGLIQQEYAKMAAELDIDFIFMFEQFCGHGFNSDDPEAPCYRGPGNENWFDNTCIHPNPTGHGVIADMFLAVIDE